MMPNLTNEKTPMPHQDPQLRSKNFDEVGLGYTKEQAIAESKRCLNCKTKPCVSGCPVNVNIPEFISHVANGDFAAAYDIIKQTNAFPAVCGRVCPQESQCERRCVRGMKGEAVAIGRLERFVADTHLCKENNATESFEPNNKNNPHKVAIIGGGPSGLACAGDLVDLGYDVTIFEAFHTAGGVLMYGIPDFRLPKDIVKREIIELENRGVKIHTNMVIGRVLSIQELFLDGYKAVYVSTGAGLPNFMNIPGEGLIGVYSANEFLTRLTLMRAYRDDYDTPIVKPRSVAVIGGGNVAMDAARSAIRLGCENVYIIYRRSEEELPARNEEIQHAKEEGVVFKLLTTPIKIIGDENNRVTHIECLEMTLGEPDESGRRRPVQKEGSNFKINVDCVIMAIGSSPNPLIKDTTPGINADKKGCLVVDDTLKTTKKGVYAGGDAVTGAATVILAMGAGKKAARSIHQYITDQ